MDRGLQNRMESSPAASAAEPCKWQLFTSAVDAAFHCHIMKCSQTKLQDWTCQHAVSPVVGMPHHPQTEHSSAGECHAKPMRAEMGCRSAGCRDSRSDQRRAARCCGTVDQPGWFALPAQAVQASDPSLRRAGTQRQPPDGPLLGWCCAACSYWKSLSTEVAMGTARTDLMPCRRDRDCWTMSSKSRAGGVREADVWQQRLGWAILGVINVVLSSSGLTTLHSFCSGKLL